MIRATNAQANTANEANQKEDALKDKEAALADAKDQLFSCRLVNRAGPTRQWLGAASRPSGESWRQIGSPERAPKRMADPVLPDTDRPSSEEELVLRVRQRGLFILEASSSGSPRSRC